MHPVGEAVIVDITITGIDSSLLPHSLDGSTWVSSDGIDLVWVRPAQVFKISKSVSSP